jgi:hypothetical protein
VVNNVKTYVLSGRLYYYADRTAEPFYSENRVYDISANVLETNLLAHLYSLISADYNNVENLL